MIFEGQSFILHRQSNNIIKIMIESEQRIFVIEFEIYTKYLLYPYPTSYSYS